MMYRQMIYDSMYRQGLNENARHVEAFMRLKLKTLDALGPTEFDAEVKTAVDAVRAVGERSAEGVAKSYGL